MIQIICRYMTQNRDPPFDISPCRVIPINVLQNMHGTQPEIR